MGLEQIRSGSQWSKDIQLTARILVYSSSRLQVLLLRPQGKLIGDIVNGLDLCKLGIFKGIPVDARIWEVSILDRGLETVAISFHRECPIAPNWSTNLDAIGYV